MLRRLTPLAAAAIGASAWGPITHYSFTCSEIGGQPDFLTCIRDHPDLISGDDFPDAFAFGSFVDGSNCTQFRSLHNNAFASQLILSARRREKDYPPKSGFNASAFALGYASHMYADDVGFFRGSVLPPKSSYTNWLKIWVYMVAIDAYHANTAHLNTLPIPELPSEGAKFIADTVAEYRQNVDPNAPQVTAEEVGWCAAAWQEVLKDKTEEALAALPATWRHQMVEFSPFGAADWHAAVAELEPSRACVRDAWQHYSTLIAAPGAKPGEVDQQAADYIASLFAAGKCTPPSPNATYRAGQLGRWPEAG